MTATEAAAATHAAAARPGRSWSSWPPSSASGKAQVARRRPVAAEANGIWQPPLDIWFASDLNLPHFWDIAAALAEPVPAQRAEPDARPVPGRRRPCTPGARRASASRSAPCSASAWPSAFVHSRLLERAFVPYVVASQTIPIVALAPLIVFCFGRTSVERRDHRHLPDLLPGDDRHDARPALARPARAGADALVRRVPPRRPLEGAPAGVPAVPVHRAEDHRHRQHRRRDHRRGARRRPGGPRPGDRELQPAVHHRPRRSCGPRSSSALAAGHPVLRARPRRGAAACCARRRERRCG